MAEVKGILVSAMKTYLTKQYGVDAVDSAIARLAPEDRALVEDRRFLDGSSYPYETMVALRRVMRQLVTTQQDAPRDVGAFIAEYVFTGPYKPLLAKDPATMVGKIPWVKDFFYKDLETVESVMTGDRSCRVTYRFGESIRPARAACASMAGFWARTLELSGASTVAATHGVCICDGADRCEFAYSW